MHVHTRTCYQDTHEPDCYEYALGLKQAEVNELYQRLLEVQQQVRKIMSWCTHIDVTVKNIELK